MSEPCTCRARAARAQPRLRPTHISPQLPPCSQATTRAPAPLPLTRPASSSTRARATSRRRRNPAPTTITLEPAILNPGLLTYAGTGALDPNVSFTLNITSSMPGVGTLSTDTVSSRPAPRPPPPSSSPALRPAKPPSPSPTRRAHPSTHLRSIRASPRP